MYFPFLNKIVEILNNILYFLIKIALLLATFFIIYLGIKTYSLTKNFKDIKTAIIYIVLGIILIGLIFLNKEIILKTIEYFVPSFK